MRFMVRLAIEGLPAHAVELEAIKQLLNKLDCQFIELFDPVDACMTEVLAWAADPSKLPKEFVLDIPEPMLQWWMPPTTDDPDMFELLVSETPPGPPTEKKCLSFDLLIHLKEVVDPVQQRPDSPSYDPFSDEYEAPRRRRHATFLGRLMAPVLASLLAAAIVSLVQDRGRRGGSNEVCGAGALRGQVLCRSPLAGAQPPVDR